MPIYTYNNQILRYGNGIAVTAGQCCGACCIDGECTSKNECDCEKSSGTWHAGKQCDDSSFSCESSSSSSDSSSSYSSYSSSSECLYGACCIRTEVPPPEPSDPGPTPDPGETYPALVPTTANTPDEYSGETVEYEYSCEFTFKEDCLLRPAGVAGNTRFFPCKTCEEVDCSKAWDSSSSSSSSSSSYSSKISRRAGWVCEPDWVCCPERRNCGDECCDPGEVCINNECVAQCDNCLNDLNNCDLYIQGRNTSEAGQDPATGETWGFRAGGEIFWGKTTPPNPQPEDGVSIKDIYTKGGLVCNNDGQWTLIEVVSRDFVFPAAANIDAAPNFVGQGEEHIIRYLNVPVAADENGCPTTFDFNNAEQRNETREGADLGAAAIDPPSMEWKCAQAQQLQLMANPEDLQTAANLVISTEKNPFYVCND